MCMSMMKEWMKFSFKNDSAHLFFNDVIVIYVYKYLFIYIYVYVNNNDNNYNNITIL